MKFGIRTPNFKKRIKAMTTGKIKRRIKKKFIPFYGKKGVGFIKNPRRSIYNHFYNKTTIDLFKLPSKVKKRRLKTMICPICNSENVNIQVINENKLVTKHHGIIWWLLIGWWWVIIKWVFLPIPAFIILVLFGRRKTLKTFQKKIYICQTCGSTWE